MNATWPEGEEGKERSETSLGASHLGAGGAEGADRFVADARGDEAVALARRSRWARHMVEESTTVLATLQASVGQEVFLTLTSTERIGVEVSALGEDYVQVRTATWLRWIRLACVIAVETASALAADPGAFDPPEGLLVEVLEDLVADELQVTLGLAGGARLTGFAISVGAAIRLQISDTANLAVIDIENIEMILLPLHQRN